MFGSIHLGSQPVPNISLLGGFLIAASISLVVICQDSLIIPDLVLEECMLLRLYPFFPDCPIRGHIVHDIFLQSFVFLWCQLLLLFHF